MIYITRGDPVVINVGLLVIDVDVDAEGVFVIDRTSANRLHIGTVPANHVAKIIVPLSYASSNKLLAGIIDADEQYNAAVIDGIRAELVDQNTVDLSQ